MEPSILLARICGVSLVIVCLGLLLNRKYYLSQVQEFFKQPLWLLILGMWDIVLGLIIITFHNLWVADWRVLITLLGWLLFIRGSARVLFPAQLISFVERQVGPHMEKVTLVSSSLFLLIGLILTYFGFKA